MAVLEAFIHDPLINWRLMKEEVTVSAVKDTDMVSASSAASIREAFHPQAPMRRPKADEKDIFNELQAKPGAYEVRNERALSVYNRVQHKLTGRDFEPDVALSVEVQVDRLIEQATTIENLAQCFVGWCAFW